MPRVLSFQSHVVHGYVGNKAATFPLQYLGYHVDAINSVQFSNHTGYPFIKGQVFSSDHFIDILKGLELNGLLDYDYILTGYMGSKASLEAVKEIVGKVRSVNPDVIFVLDPVMGDNGKFYVPEEVIPVYRDEMLSLATLITPNHFEAKLLTGVKITDRTSALNAVNALHEKGVANVVLTSYPVGETELVLVGSRKGDEQFEIKFLRLAAHFTGTGDLLASLLLAFYKAHGLRNGCERAISVMQKILGSTLAKSRKLNTEASSRSDKMRNVELDIIECRSMLSSEEVIYKASLIE